MTPAPAAAAKSTKSAAGKALDYTVLYNILLLCVYRYREAEEWSKALNNSNRSNPIDNQKELHPTALTRKSILEDSNEIQQCLKDLIESTSNSPRWIDFFAIIPEEIEKLKKDTGLDLKGYHHTIDKIGLNHILNRHGQNEENRGDQSPITLEDIFLIPLVLKSYDCVSYEGKNSKKLDVICYKKRIDGVLYYLEEVRTRRKKLAPTTMYKKRVVAAVAGSAENRQLPARTSETTTANHSRSIILESAIKVNKLRFSFNESHYAQNELFVEIKNKTNVRIDKYLAEQVPSLSRSRIQQLIEAGHVLLNDKPAPRVSEKLKPGDRIEVTLPPPEPSGIPPENIPLDILYQDPHLLVLNKPPGLCVHPTESMKTGTLVNALLYHVTDLSGIGGILRPGIVHRLDRVTSGVILIAKNDETHRALSEDFKQRRIRKVYWALAHGRPPRIEGEISLSIGRHPTNRKIMAPRPDGRPSLTRYRILREGLGGTLLELYPVTGRTHQIRVHLRHLGCPVIRDSLYALKKYQGKGTLERLFEGYPGIALHAKSIRFRHPITQEEMNFEAPLPEAFQSIVDQLL